MPKKRKKPKEKQNPGGLGRPPAKWLISKGLPPHSRVSFREIATRTKKPLIAVRRLSEKYSAFLEVQHELAQTISLATLKTDRLFHLHDVLRSDFVLRKHLRWREHKQSHSLRGVFDTFLKAAHSAGYREDDDDEELSDYSEKIELDDIDRIRCEILGELKL